jgi:uncharacterized protein (DUF488 family)
MTTIYTIGHSNHKTETFVEMLRQHAIELLIDVRSSPYSRYVPQANRETLARALRAAGIAYDWLGDRLGGKPGGIVADYDELRASPAFQQGIDRLIALAAERRTVIMCAEGDHRQCHRHKLITPALLDQAVCVHHIQPDGSIVDEVQEPRQLSLF